VSHGRSTEEARPVLSGMYLMDVVQKMCEECVLYTSVNQTLSWPVSRIVDDVVCFADTDLLQPAVMQI